MVEATDSTNTIVMFDYFKTCQQNLFHRYFKNDQKNKIIICSFIPLAETEGEREKRRRRRRRRRRWRRKREKKLHNVHELSSA